MFRYTKILHPTGFIISCFTFHASKGRGLGWGIAQQVEFFVPGLNASRKTRRSRWASLRPSLFLTLTSRACPKYARDGGHEAALPCRFAHERFGELRYQAIRKPVKFDPGLSFGGNLGAIDRLC